MPCQGGLCRTHGARVKRCRHPGGCAKYAQRGGVCFTHGADRATCGHVGCTKNARKGGFCYRHSSAAAAARAPPSLPPFAARTLTVEEIGASISMTSRLGGATVTMYV